jgi:hypothetical protein
MTASAQQLRDLMHCHQQLIDIQVTEKQRLSRAAKTIPVDIEDQVKQLEQHIESLNQGSQDALASINRQSGGHQSLLPLQWGAPSLPNCGLRKR